MVPQQTPSLDARARPIIEESLAASERLLNEGHGRRAVQEILWLLETITTAFRDTGPEDATVQGQILRHNREGDEGARARQGAGADTELDDDDAPAVTLRCYLLDEVAECMHHALRSGQFRSQSECLVSLNRCLKADDPVPAQSQQSAQIRPFRFYYPDKFRLRSMSF
jgi:hypothetical protein